MKIAHLSNASDGFLRGICVASSLFRYEPDFFIGDNYSNNYPTDLIGDTCRARIPGPQRLFWVQRLPKYFLHFAEIFFDFINGDIKSMAKSRDQTHCFLTKDTLVPFCWPEMMWTTKDIE